MLFQVPDRGTMIRELEQRKLRNTKASVAFGSAKVRAFSEKSTVTAAVPKTYR